MKKSKKILIANWKMNPQTIDEAKKIIRDIKKGLSSLKKVQTVICPPFIYLPLFSSAPSTNLQLGVQNIFYELSGSYTGEISANQLYQFKVGFVLVGHSERRKMGETDEIVNKKAKSAVNEGMTAVICIGEEKHDSQGEYLSVLRDQITLALKDISKKFIDHVIVAYEPIWAIGAKSSMNSRDIHETSIFIKKVLRDLYGISGDGVRILYGGAVGVDNAKSIVGDGFVDGLLVGRESLKAKSFVEIGKQVESI